MRNAVPSAGRFRVSRQAARALRARWRAVGVRELEELRRASHDEKVQQLARLIESLRAFGWDAPLADEDEAVRERWRRLRRAYRA